MPTLGRPREFDRENALQAAMQVFWRKGFLATSMTDLCETMGIRSPSLYAAFGSKEALYVEAVEYYANTIGGSVWGQLAVGATARDGVDNLLLAAVEKVDAAGVGPVGCMIALGGLGEACPPAIDDTFKRYRLECLDMLRSRFTAAVAAAELPASTDIEQLSRFYFAVYQSIAAQARDGANPSQLTGIVTIAMAAWPALTV